MSVVVDVSIPEPWGFLEERPPGCAGGYVVWDSNWDCRSCFKSDGGSRCGAVAGGPKLAILSESTLEEVLPGGVVPPAIGWQLY